MRKFLFLLFCISTLISCGKRRVISAQGDMVMGNSQVHWEIFTENDTCFKTFSDNGKFVAVATSATEAELMDSTFSEKDFSKDGKLLQIKCFLNGKPDGEWTSFYPNGKKKSVSVTENGAVKEYRAWYDNGQAQVNGSRLANGRMTRREFFKNGKTSQEFDIDSIGTGTCTSFFANGKKMASGNIFQFSPVGVWNRWDSLGAKRSDTLYGIDAVKK